MRDSGVPETFSTSRNATPVAGDVKEESMLNFVPLLVPGGF
jgi:hypothetical protein